MSMTEFESNNPAYNEYYRLFQDLLSTIVAFDNVDLGAVVIGVRAHRDAHPGTPLANSAQFHIEMIDAITGMQMLVDAGIMRARADVDGLPQ
jgi:hypothetical protein